VTPPSAYAFDRQRIVVADEDPLTCEMIVDTLRREGHCVSLDPAALSADDTLADYHLLISSLCVAGVVRMDLLESLRASWPTLQVLFLAREGPLPTDLSSLCLPFTPAELRAAVRRLLPALQDGTVLARSVAAASREGPGSPMVESGCLDG